MMTTSSTISEFNVGSTDSRGFGSSGGAGGARSSSVGSADGRGVGGGGLFGHGRLSTGSTSMGKSMSNSSMDVSGLQTPRHANSVSGATGSGHQELMRPPPPSSRPLNLFATSTSPTSSTNASTHTNHNNTTPGLQFTSQHSQRGLFPDSTVSSSLAPQSHSQQRRRTFESTATTQEYSVLSSILHGNSSHTATNIALSDVPSTSSPAFSDDSQRTDNSTYFHPNYLNQFSLGNSPRHNFSEILASVDMTQQQANDWLNDTPKPPPISFTIADSIDNMMDPELRLFEEQFSTVAPGANGETPTATGTGDTTTGTPAPPTPVISATDTTSLSLAGTGSENQPRYTTSSRMNNRLGGFSNTGSWQPLKKPADIYRNVRQPFPYTPGFHSLIKYLKSRFDKPQLIQMAKCMARYRPSFIACTNSLDEDDLVFMEQCFQRTLLEYEKYISFSGTPTAVWRRTGQIAAVGKEFCILTGWSRQQLLDRDGSGTGGMFIVEVMQDESVLEYFQMFSDIAFGDSRGAMMSECSLLTPNGKTIRTTSMWTLKRDVFGIPMMIIGNFLPILS
ncbi:Ert1p [Sugiyamaella lignohabitans]|uniref:Ert1p n=1 Tax=Sugiyamaella lignohabitans TaxID=796027 RepID=A0A167DA54_9ASCO|nr:Ert1p [Sugiyamaella lignohabitans]ANB12666.1 Ert1p [Sugiyamaella lignohabitans]